jgi:hypothetical protein
LSAKASKAVEGAGIPTFTTVVSITSTTTVDRLHPDPQTLNDGWQQAGITAA